VRSDCGNPPFGGYSEPETNAATGTSLLPAFSNPGNLYIGFSGLDPPQPLTLLFQMSAAAAGGWDISATDTSTDNTSPGDASPSDTNARDKPARRPLPILIGKPL